MIRYHQKIATVAVIMVTTQPTDAVVPNPHPGTCQTSSKYYRLLNVSLTWNNAKIACEDSALWNNYGMLATIRSSEEQTMVERWITRDTWIGGRFNLESSSPGYEWLGDNASMNDSNYNHWYSDHGTHHLLADGHVSILRTNDYRWAKEFEETAEKPFLCEYCVQNAPGAGPYTFEVTLDGRSTLILGGSGQQSTNIKFMHEAGGRPGSCEKPGLTFNSEEIPLTWPPSSVNP